MDDTLIEKIKENVESFRDEMVRAVSDIVKIKSVSPEFAWEPALSTGGEGEVARYIKPILDGMGVETEIFEKAKGRANVCGRLKGAGGGRGLVFNGHMDVVPPGEAGEWGGDDPFSGWTDEEYIYGRGAVDMKGGLISAVFALKALQKSGVGLKGDVVFQFVAGEECKANDIGTTACIRRGYTADAAIICEPTCSETSPFAIQVASVGVLEMKWRVRGKSCHVGMRREVIHDGGTGAAVGVDAIEKGMIIYNALKELEKQWGQSKTHPLYPAGQFCINGAVVSGGVAPSLVSPNMEMSYAIIYPPQDSAGKIREEIEQCVRNACGNDPWLRENPPEVVWLFDWPPFNTDEGEDICSALRLAAQKIRAGAGSFDGFKAVCDASFFREEGVPAVVLGPGDVRYVHCASEKLSIDQLLDAAKIYAAVMAIWCEVF